MDEIKVDGLTKQKKRKKRVQRMKTFIITFISVWMALSIIVITMMCFKMISMQKQLDELMGYDVTYTDQNEKNLGNDDTSGITLQQVDLDKDNLANNDDIRKVYLTFDDGPSENTNRILDILDDYNVKATFFVTGKEDEASIAAYQRIVAEGHTIAMHSYSHKYSDIYSSAEAFQTDFEKIRKLIFDTTGVACKYYRFPGGSSNKVSTGEMAKYIQYVNEQGITYFDWNISSGDATASAYTANELVENVMDDVVKYKTSIVLMHDATTKQATVEALPNLIESLQATGAMILPIDQDTTVIQHVSIQN